MPKLESIGRSRPAALEAKIEILRELAARPGRWVSGADLAARLSLSRTAVSNHVRALRRLGYSIESASARGHRLTSIPDTIHPVELWREMGRTGFPAEIHFFERTDSTSTQAAKMAEAGAPHGTLVLAERQDAGRGRLGRGWSSPAGSGLYFSLLLRPELPPHQAPQLTLLAAVAVARAVEEIAGVAPEIKWPNDLLLGGKKFCGILTEMAGGVDRVRWVILGIGINVTTQEFPGELQPLATSLALGLGRPPPRRAPLLAAVLAQLEGLLGQYASKGFPLIGLEWERYAKIGGRSVRVSAPDGTKLEGIARGLASDGALLLERPGGALERILAGDVGFA